MSNEPEPRVRYGGSFELVSVRQGLIELEFGDRLRIRGIEFGGLIEREVSLGWGAGGTQQRRPAGKIEVGENGVDGIGIGDEACPSSRVGGLNCQCRGIEVPSGSSYSALARPGSVIQIVVTNGVGDGRTYEVVYLPPDFPELTVTVRREEIADGVTYLTIGTWLVIIDDYAVAIERLSQRWTRPIKHWPGALNHFAIAFDEHVGTAVRITPLTGSGLRGRAPRRGTWSASVRSSRIPGSGASRCVPESPTEPGAGTTASGCHR